MRRLGFLEILLSKCIAENEMMSADYLGERLWEWARNHQKEYLEILRAERGLKKEVGTIAERIAWRYVKYATEIGFLTQGTDKQLTDLGRLFKFFHKKDFLISQNKGQQILMIETLLNKDRIFFVNFINKITKSQKLSKSEIFDWFSTHCIPEIIKKLDRSEDERLIERLAKSAQQFRSQNKLEKKLGYDKIKHMVDTRVENLADVSVIDKAPSNYYANELTKILAVAFSKFDNSRELVINVVSKYFKVSKRATKKQLIQTYITQYELLANPPIETVYLPTLHYCMFIDGIINQNCLIMQKEIESLEELLFKKYYGKIVFLRDRDGKLTHININEKIKSIMKRGKA